MKKWLLSDKFHPSPTSMRRGVQLLFCLTVVGLGMQFYFFVSQLEAGIIPGFERPPGVEAFLPISALVSFKHLLISGKINSIHPAALVIFLIACITAFWIKKGFCSWVCPIGLLSDFLARLHAICFTKKVTLPFPADLLLRSLKYGLAGFFIWSIFYRMPANSIEQFIYSPYNQFADIKMLYFFSDMSRTVLTSILILIILSVIVPYFWCRYLCPYGAILGLISFFSIGKIKRNPSACTDCGRCEKTCPGLIKIRQKEKIHSSECTACMTCVKVCPEKKAIGFSMFAGKLYPGPVTMALIPVCIFFAGIMLAKVSGNWQNSITKPAYLRYVNRMQWELNTQTDPQKMEKIIRMMKQVQAQRAQQAQSFKKKGK